MAKSAVKQLNKRTLLYNSGQTPPFKILFASALQHMIILLSMGMAVPVTIAKAAGLDLRLSGTLLALALFITGLTTILQSARFRLWESGYMGFAAVNSASISAGILAVNAGGIPLVLGMTIFSGVLGMILVSPMVMGVLVLLITTFANHIGTKKVFAFESAIAPSNISVLNDEIESVCSQKGINRKLIRKIQISVDSLCESVYEAVPDARMQVTIQFDSHQLCIHAESSSRNFPQDFLCLEDSPEETSDICLMILHNIYDSVETRVSEGRFQADLAVDL